CLGSGSAARERDQPLEGGGRAAVVDRVARGVHAQLEGLAQPGDVEGGAGVQDHGVAARSGLAVEHGADDRSIGRGVAAAQILRRSRPGAELARVDRGHADLPAPHLGHQVLAGRRQLVQPPAPWATSACSVPSAASTCAIGSTSSGAYTPTTCRCAPAGFVSGPSTLNTVRTPSSRLTGPAWRMAGWWAWANMNPNPTSSMQSATSAGARSIRTPSASSTSADPLRDDTARLPCLATYAPPAAATSAADVEMLNVWAPSPPVPAVSTSVWCCGRAGVTWARMARAQPVISPTVSPFIRR